MLPLGAGAGCWPPCQHHFACGSTRHGGLVPLAGTCPRSTTPWLASASVGAGLSLTETSQRPGTHQHSAQAPRHWAQQLHPLQPSHPLRNVFQPLFLFCGALSLFLGISDLLLQPHGKQKQGSGQTPKDGWGVSAWQQAWVKSWSPLPALMTVGSVEAGLRYEQGAQSAKVCPGSGRQLGNGAEVA